MEDGEIQLLVGDIDTPSQRFSGDPVSVPISDSTGNSPERSINLSRVCRYEINSAIVMRCSFSRFFGRVTDNSS